MAGQKISGMDYYYNAALFGARSPFANNPSVQRQTAIQQNIERNISELAVNRFKWSGLPKSIDPRFLEVTMLLNGMTVFYWDDNYDKLLAVKASATGYINFMDWPLSYTIIGPGSKVNAQTAGAAFVPKTLSGFNPFIDYKEGEAQRKGIPMWGNYFRQSDIDTIQLYSSRLATTDMTLEINTRNARQNKVVTSTSNTQLSFVNLARQIDEGVNVIQPKDAGMLDNIAAIDLGIDYNLFDSLSVLRTRWWNECMGLLGIDNANQDKKERLVADEVSANNGQTDSMRYVALNARKQACEYINEVFGDKLDGEISVDFNTEVEAQARQMAAQQGINTDGETPDDGKGGDE